MALTLKLVREALANAEAIYDGGKPRGAPGTPPSASDDEDVDELAEKEEEELNSVLSPDQSYSSLHSKDMAPPCPISGPSSHPTATASPDPQVCQGSLPRAWVSPPPPNAHRETHEKVYRVSFQPVVNRRKSGKCAAETVKGDGGGGDRNGRNIGGSRGGGHGGGTGGGKAGGLEDRDSRVGRYNDTIITKIMNTG